MARISHVLLYPTKQLPGRLPQLWETTMKYRLLTAGLATVMAFGLGSVSANAAPLGGTTNHLQAPNELLVKTHGDRYDYAPWWKRRHFRHDDDGYRFRPWWWRHRYHGDDYRFDRRHHADRDDRGERRWHRDR